MVIVLLMTGIGRARCAAPVGAWIPAVTYVCFRIRRNLRETLCVAVSFEWRWYKWLSI
jgi:hypothetical protein